MAKCKIDEEMIKKIIKQHYPVLLGFDLAEGNITFKQYMEKVRQFNK